MDAGGHICQRIRLEPEIKLLVSEKIVTILSI